MKVMKMDKYYLFLSKIDVLINGFKNYLSVDDFIKNGKLTAIYEKFFKELINFSKFLIERCHSEDVSTCVHITKFLIIILPLYSH